MIIHDITRLIVLLRNRKNGSSTFLVEEPFFPLFMLFITVLAAVNLVFLVGKIKNMRKLLFHGSDAARILAVDHVDQTLRKF